MNETVSFAVASPGPAPTIGSEEEFNAAYHEFNRLVVRDDRSPGEDRRMEELAEMMRVYDSTPPAPMIGARS